MPRSTLQHWLQRHSHPDLEPELVTFCVSPAGQRVLRRLVLALHLAFHLTGPGGLRPLSRFLRLSQLDHFVAPSYGSQQALALRLQDELVGYADRQRQRLAPARPARTISACLDENFHGVQTCLVAVEPVSNFLLPEAYHDCRDGPTWTAALNEALRDLPVQVVQVTGDQAKGLIACARDGLEAHHSPDLFHGQRELSRAVALPLQRQTEAAAKELGRATAHTQQQQHRQQEYERGPRPPGRPPDLAGDLRPAENYQRHAAAQWEQCRQRQEQAREQVRGVADDYHPFDAADGRPLTAAAVEQRLGERVQAVEELVAAARLGTASQEAVAKARRWLVPVTATVAWFREMAGELVNGLGLESEARRSVTEQLLPGLYWQREAARGRDAGQRQQRRELSQRLLTQAWSGPLAHLAEEKQAQVRRVAQEAVELFQRSSSCVEGRNGQLALHHHGQGPLSAGRLRALTAVHNFVLERPDGTTAAERFFGSKPEPVFEWLLERLPELPRPVRKATPPQEAVATAAEGWPNP